MEFFVLTSYINGLASLLLGLFVLLRNPQGAVNRAFCFLAFMVSLWGLGIAKEVTASNEIAALLWLRFFHLGVCFIPIAFLHFSLEVINAASKNKKLIFFGYIISLSFIAMIPFKIFIEGVQKVIQFPFYLKPAFMYHFFMIYFVAYPAIAEWKLFLASKTLKGNKSKQALYVFFAGLIGFLGGLTSYLPAYNVKIYPLMNGFVFLYVLILTVSVVRHRLMDIELVIKKALVFTGLFFMVMIAVTMATLMSQSYLGAHLKLHPLVSTALGVVFAMLLYDPIREYLIRVTDKYLFQKKFDYRKILKAASEGLSHVDSLTHQLKLVTHFITSRARIKSAAIYMPENGEHDFSLKSFYRFRITTHFELKIVFDSQILMYLKNEKEHPYLEHYEIEEEARRFRASSRTYRYKITGMQEEMQKLGAHLIIPSFYQDEIQGVLVLGEKRSEEPYNEEDINLFQTIAQESAIAFENARKHDELVAERDKVAQMNDELRKSQEQVIITKQEAAVSQLSGGIAHEVKNSIVGLIGGLDETQNAFETITRNLNDWYRSGRPVPYAEKQELFFSLKNAMESLEYARGESLHIDDIVHTLSQLSKGQYAQMTRILLTTFLNRMISVSMLRTYGDQVRTQALEDPPELIVEDKVSAVRGHTELLKAVFINLFKNAIFAMDNVQSKKIRIYVAQDSPDKVRIEFSDNGCGISPEVLPKIFDYGFTTKGSEGEGKGLHNVKMIIEKEHKGSIDVKSEGGKGTTFIIKLPVWKDRPDDE